MRIQFQSLLRSNFRCGRMLGHRTQEACGRPSCTKKNGEITGATKTYLCPGRLCPGFFAAIFIKNKLHA